MCKFFLKFTPAKRQLQFHDIYIAHAAISYDIA